MRHFNTAGPVFADKHYAIPPLDRIDTDQVLDLACQEKNLVLHAPCQTGKTSALLALQDHLNSGAAGEYRCVYANVEGGQTAREDVSEAVNVVLGGLAEGAKLAHDDAFLDGVMDGPLKRTSPHRAIQSALSLWAQADARPLVLLIDEIDALVGDSLLAVLRQLRAGYHLRPERFPQSIVLCGLRDIRDYQIHSGSAGRAFSGSSAFNIVAKSLRLGDFSLNDLRSLLDQHTDETGQQFTDQAVETIWDRTQGQPWLVNALCQRACFDDPRGRDRTLPVSRELILDAQEQLVLDRVTHLDQLAYRLREKRVQRVVEPLLSGTPHRNYSAEDLEYSRDLGLVAVDDPPRIANPIYAEVVPRQLTAAVQSDILQDPAWYVRSDGALDMHGLLEGFQDWFRQNSEHWIGLFQYKEAGPQLLLQAFLQRIVNGGGRVEREYGIGRGRTDLLIFWPETVGGDPARMRAHVVECKVAHDTRGLGPAVRSGLEQTREYMGRCGAESGHLVVFDLRPGRPWEDRIYCRQETQDGRTVTVWGA